METKNQRGLTQAQIDGAVAFHGHHCPGLSIGLRAAEWALEEFGRAGDEEIVVVSETDMCAADAIQFLVGCTFGKGNFIFRDAGKVAFSFYRRSDGKKGRIVLNPDFAADLRARQESIDSKDKAKLAEIKKERIARIMSADLNELFRFSVPRDEAPSRARLHKTVRCEVCDEGVMEPRIVVVDGKKLCVDCAAARR